MSSTGATLSGSFSGASGDTRNWGFQWGTSSSSLSGRVYSDGLSGGNSFTYELGGLEPEKTYYYRAIIEEYDDASKTYVDRVSSVVKTFTTPAIGQSTGETNAAFGKGWAELPLATSNSSLTENETQCVKYITDMSKQSNGFYHRNYSFCYDTQHYVARWVAYPMHSYYTGGSASSETFYTDPSFTTSQQPGSTYTGDYDRGHQIAKANRTVSSEARKQTNYYTNMTPQNHTLNGGNWSQLEAKERGAWMCSDTLYVVTGCHFDNYNTTTSSSSSSDTRTFYAPTHYFKVMLRTKNGSTGKKVQDCSANELICAGYWVANNASATPVIKSVAEIESLTGLTFFVNVPNAPKSSYSASDWE